MDRSIDLKGNFGRVIGLGIGVAILIAFIFVIGVDNIQRILLQVNPLIVVVMVAIQLLGFVFYAAAWYLLIRATGHNIRFLTCQGITFASIFASYTMPSGVFLEALRCFFASKEAHMKLGESTATVILHRILYVIGFLASTALALFALLLAGKVGYAAMLQLAPLPIIAIVGLIVFLHLSWAPKRLQPLLDRFMKLAQPLITLVRKEARVNGKTDEFLTHYQLSFRRMLSSRRHLAASFAASLGDWGCSVLILWVVLGALGVYVSLWVVTITMAIGKMIQMTPIAIPGMLGIYETAITTSLSLFAVPVSLAASAALLSRIVTSWLDLPVTGIAAYHYGFKLLRVGTRPIGTP